MRIFREVKTYRILPLVALLAIAAVPATAQQDPPKPENTPATVDKASEEIVVTARRREENLQEVPIAVTVVTADKLEEAATADISELQGQVPNLAIYQGRNQ